MTLRIAKNTTDIPTYFFRRVVLWVAREIELPLGKLPELSLGNAKAPSYYSFTQAHCSITIGRMGVHFTSRLDRMTALVRITTGALLAAKLWPRFRGQEYRRLQRRATDSVMDAFERDAETLLDTWMRQPEREPKPVASPETQALARVERLLVGWRRKLALAQTKVAKYEAEERELKQKVAEV